MQVNWRRGPRQMKRALDRTREKFLREVESEVRRKAPSSVKSTITRTAAQVVIGHPAARFIEAGMKPGTMPPLTALALWAKSVGKDPRDAFPIARAIKARGIPARPFIKPAIELALSHVDDEFKRIWEGERKG